MLIHREKTHGREGSQNHLSRETDASVEVDCTSRLEIP